MFLGSYRSKLNINISVLFESKAKEFWGTVYLSGYKHYLRRLNRCPKIDEAWEEIKVRDQEM